MSVTFTDGVQTDRGETIPADGTALRLDVSDASKGASSLHRQRVTTLAPGSGLKRTAVDVDGLSGHGGGVLGAEVADERSDLRGSRSRPIG